ncbi:prolyl oligopeptidase family serine peptidase [Deinococcus aquaticus]|uniref:Prolyl oligopeptidase family serine peptidase n=1 Tax=Deinococcus aquaticus TaxID=328692 RepID=A0ABY7V3N0_9DEIO|nr:prolyl oligopeptidase family serine peptidase [Deinococcus aquaticus]WDA59715.1 prolyl oligopeptidase family serine peptidase [Deinococcus aquaticus]
MRRLINLVLFALVLGAAFVAVTQPDTLPFRLPWNPPVTGTPAAPGEEAPDSGRPLQDLSDTALKAAVSRNPISIQALKAREYPGSALTVRQTLAAGSNYTRQVVSYQSEGLRINALLTVPRGTPPQGGWPAIVFNHGYIPPAEYRTTERYVAYQDAFARAGFVTLKSDYRGHGSSEGQALGGYNDPGYTVDVLNAAASLRRDPRVNPARMGLWGHSMGGQLSLKAMIVDPSLKAASLWAGVIASYDVLSTDWNPPPGEKRTLDALNRRYLRLLSPNAYLKELNGRPIQLHHGTNDKDVPYSFQKNLADDLRNAGQSAEAYRYEGDNHNLSGNLRVALNRSVQFFKDNL